MNITTEWERWCRLAGEDPDLQADLMAMKDAPEQMEDAFYRSLAFGTGGLRGVIGAGTNRMNLYMVRKATQGLANYLLDTFSQPSAAIAYDSRIKSDLFAAEAARVLAANGIQVYLYAELMPTPALSFAVRQLGCSAGICITASHNPAVYNGYKVYGSDGGQITQAAAERILAEMDAVDIFTGVRTVPWEQAVSKKQIVLIGDEVRERFLDAIQACSLRKIKTGIKVVYTPLNGAGKRCVLEMLERVGIDDITLVPEQSEPDGYFPTCLYPNPEKREALEKGMELCRKSGADLLLATDPDCDRIGVAVKSEGDYRLLTGNETGILLLDYILRTRSQRKDLPPSPVAVKTIVTSELAARIAADYQVELRNVLTGFKYIGEEIGSLEAEGTAERFVFGFEESCGYLIGSYARDKDAVGAAMMVCEMLAYYQEQGLTLAERMEQIYRQYGYYQNRLLEYTFPGSRGMARMGQIMDQFRSGTALSGIGVEVTGRIDYLEGVDGLPPADVISFQLAEGDGMIIRPSGTEPKIKVYLSLTGADRDSVEKKGTVMEERISDLIDM